MSKKSKPLEAQAPVKAVTESPAQAVKPPETPPTTTNSSPEKPPQK